MAETTDNHKHNNDKKDDPMAGVAEVSPNKRYIRWNDVISNLNSKFASSYKAFDTRNGIEVVWHIVGLDTMTQSEQIRLSKIYTVLREVHNKNILEHLDVWSNNDTHNLTVITAQLEPLNEFISKVKTLRWKIVKKWAKQILRGLNFLHNLSPKMIHRNLHCGHIYINGGTSNTAIGDFWMSTLLSDDPDSADVSIDPLTSLYSQLCTPPDTTLSIKYDIYSFGMCILEMITHEKPYQEYIHKCSTSDIMNQYINHGILPKIMEKITNPLAYEFLKICLSPLETRPTSEELLEHRFLQNGDDDDDEIVMNQQKLHIVVVPPDISIVEDYSKPIQAKIEASLISNATDISSTALNITGVTDSKDYNSSQIESKNTDLPSNLRHVPSTIPFPKTASDITDIKLSVLPTTMTSSSTLHTAIDNSQVSHTADNISKTEMNSPARDIKEESIDKSKKGSLLMSSSTTTTVQNTPMSAIKVERGDHERPLVITSLESGDNVLVDKGIHDGRNNDDENTNDYPPLSNIKNTINPPFPPSKQPTTTMSTSTMTQAHTNVTESTLPTTSSEKQHTLVPSPSSQGVAEKNKSPPITATATNPTPTPAAAAVTASLKDIILQKANQNNTITTTDNTHIPENNMTSRKNENTETISPTPIIKVDTTNILAPTTNTTTTTTTTTATVSSNNVMHHYSDKPKYTLEELKILLRGKKGDEEDEEEEVEEEDDKGKIALNMTIPAEKTKEKKSLKEIEFIFDIFHDTYEVVAKEMIEELDITMSIEDLAMKIELLIDQVIQQRQDKATVPSTTTADAVVPISTTTNTISMPETNATMDMKQSVTGITTTGVAQPVTQNNNSSMMIAASPSTLTTTLLPPNTTTTTTTPATSNRDINISTPITVSTNNPINTITILPTICEQAEVESLPTMTSMTTSLVHETTMTSTAIPSQVLSTLYPESSKIYPIPAVITQTSTGYYIQVPPPPPPLPLSTTTISPSHGTYSQSSTLLTSTPSNNNNNNMNSNKLTPDYNNEENNTVTQSMSVLSPSVVSPSVMSPSVLTNSQLQESLHDLSQHIPNGYKLQKNYPIINNLQMITDPQLPTSITSFTSYNEKIMSNLSSTHPSPRLEFNTMAFSPPSSNTMSPTKALSSTEDDIEKDDPLKSLLSVRLRQRIEDNTMTGMSTLYTISRDSSDPLKQQLSQDTLDTVTPDIAQLELPNQVQESIDTVRTEISNKSLYIDIHENLSNQLPPLPPNATPIILSRQLSPINGGSTCTMSHTPPPPPLPSFTSSSSSSISLLPATTTTTTTDNFTSPSPLSAPITIPSSSTNTDNSLNETTITCNKDHPMESTSSLDPNILSMTESIISTDAISPTLPVIDTCISYNITPSIHEELVDKDGLIMEGDSTVLSDSAKTLNSDIIASYKDILMKSTNIDPTSSPIRYTGTTDIMVGMNISESMKQLLPSSFTSESDTNLSSIKGTLEISETSRTHTLSETELLEIQQEIEKIDKETRIARRAFEQRIQKHKIIQEKCDEDIHTLTIEYHNKMNELNKKEEATIKKRDEEIKKIQLDMEAKLEAYKNRKREERVKQKGFVPTQ